MKANIGQNNTEQFTVESILDGETLKVQPIHDPFIHSTIGFRPSRWQCFKWLLRPALIKAVVIVRGSEGAMRAIMTLDPEELARETKEILEQRRIGREAPGAIGNCVLHGTNPD